MGPLAEAADSGSHSHFGTVSVGRAAVVIVVAGLMRRVGERDDGGEETEQAPDLGSWIAASRSS